MKIVKNNFSIEFIHDYDLEDGNEDIIVNYNGDRYSATIFTIANINELMENYRLTGECNNGSYFFCQDMLIIKDLKRKTIIETISRLIEEGEFEFTLKRLSSSE